MTDDLLAQSFERLLQEHCTPAHVRDIENGGPADALWTAVEQSGFLDALIPEEKGGAGLALRDVFPLAVLCGRYAVPVPVSETMVAGAIYVAASQEAPEGPVTDWEKVPFKTADVRRATGAAIAAALLVGAMERAFEITVAFANDRTQFGRPIGKFQAVQQQISVMAEQTFAAKWQLNWVLPLRTGCLIPCWPPSPRPGPVKPPCSSAPTPMRFTGPSEQPKNMICSCSPAVFMQGAQPLAQNPTGTGLSVKRFWPQARTAFWTTFGISYQPERFVILTFCR